MNEATHTPGPWTASRYGAVRYDVTGGGRSVAIVGRCQQARLDHLNIARSTIAARGEAGHLAEQEAQALESLQPQVEADARLIAAAPDLLAALKEALDVMPFGLTNSIEWMVAAKDAEIERLTTVNEAPGCGGKATDYNSMSDGDTPEAALQQAGMMKGEK